MSVSWLLARLRLRVRHESVSPREMAPGLKRASPNPVDFRSAVQLYGYRMPAIRVDSAEAWHYHFQWTSEIEEDAAQLLSSSAPGAMVDEEAARACGAGRPRRHGRGRPHAGVNAVNILRPGLAAYNPLPLA